MKKLTLIICLMLIAATGFTQWISQTVNSSTEKLESIFFTDTDTGYTCGNGANIYKTVDSGNIWTLVHTDTIAIAYLGLFFYTPSVGYAVGGNGTILKTLDGGNTWIQQTSGISNVLRKIDCPAPDTCFVSGDGVILKTTDGGASWHTKYTGPEFLWGIDFIDSQIGYVVGSKTMKTTDGGDTWITKDNKWSNGVSFVNKDTGYVIPGYDTLKKTIDGGDTWQSISTNTSGFLYTGIQALNENLVMLVCSCQVVTVAKTYDGGITWSIQVQPNDTFRGNNIFFFDDNNGWIVGENYLPSGTHNVYHTTNGGNFVEENQIPESAINIFPNPTNDNLTIETPENATIEILNIEGQIIKAINITDKQTSIDVSDLSNGVYIIKAKTDKGLAVKKFVKE